MEEQTKESLVTKRPEEIITPPSSAQPEEPSVEKKPLTVIELKTGNVYLPKLFFQRKASPMQFGIVVHGFLRNIGMGVPHEDAVVVPGYLWGSDTLTPVEIAVSAYLYYSPNASAKEIATQRKLPKALVECTLAAMEEIGMFAVVAYGSDRLRKPATLEDFLGNEEVG